MKPAGPGERMAVSTCPRAVADAFAMLAGRWTLPILHALLAGPHGFNELGRAVGGCNPATLRERLGALEARGIVSRTVVSVMPPRTRYELTAAGRALRPVLAAVDTWAGAHGSAAPAPRCPAA